MLTTSYTATTERIFQHISAHATAGLLPLKSRNWAEYQPLHGLYYISLVPTDPAWLSLRLTAPRGTKGGVSKDGEDDLQFSPMTRFTLVKLTLLLLASRVQPAHRTTSTHGMTYRVAYTLLRYTVLALQEHVLS